MKLAKSPFRFLPRQRKKLGVGFLDVLSLAKKSKPFRGQDDTSWQDLFLPQSLVGAPEKKISAWSVTGLTLVGALSLAVVLAQLWQLQIAHGQENLQASDGNRVRIRNLAAPRGVIYDRNGVVLATSEPGFRLVVETIGLSTKELQTLSDLLSGLLGAPSGEILAKLNQPQLSEVILKSGLSRDEAIALELKVSSHPEVRIDSEPIRTYPNGKTLAHLLGYLGEINESELADPKYSGYSQGAKIGRTGIEAAYDYLLRGRDGKELVEVDSLGRTERVIAREEPVPGHNLVLTADLTITKTLESELIKYIGIAKTNRGAAIVENPQNGEVLAYVSYPSFDPNLFSHGISQADYRRLTSDPALPLFDRVISGTYPPGSTFKPTVSVAALSEKVTTKDRLINSPGQITLGTQVFRNWRASGFGLQNIVDAIAHSNDVYFYIMGGELGVDRLSPWAEKLGFGELSGIKIPGETKGNVPTKAWKESTYQEVWYPGDNYNYGIGQGFLLVTPIQLVGSIATIANGGVLYQPILLKEVRDSDNLVVSRDNPVVRRANLISPEVDTVVKEGMKKACATYVNLAGDDGCKTGTAEFGVDSTHAWFTTFAPWENPILAAAILIEGSGHGVTGSAVARPLLQPYLGK